MNILDTWKESVEKEASRYNMKFQFDHTQDLHGICKDFKAWFGNDFFWIKEKELHQVNTNEILSPNWLISILNDRNINSINTVLEFWRVLSYHNKVDPGRINYLNNFLLKKKFRQFRDYYFELYSFFMFNENGICHDFKVFEGRNELEGIIEIAEKKCLVECRKLYYHKFGSISMNTDFLSKIVKYLYKNPEGIIVSIGYDNPDRSLVDKIIKEISSQIKTWSNQDQNSLYLPSEINVENKVRIRLELYSPNRFDDLKKSINSNNYVLFQSEATKMTDGTGQIYLKLKFDNKVIATSEELSKRFLEAIKKKRKDRTNSSFWYRIFLFESENYSGFDRGLFILNSFSDELGAKIQRYLDQKSTADIIVLILKESNNVDFPRVRKFIFGNSGTEEIVEALNRMKFQFN